MKTLIRGRHHRPLRSGLTGLEPTTREAAAIDAPRRFELIVPCGAPRVAPPHQRPLTPPAAPRWPRHRSPGTDGTHTSENPGHVRETSDAARRLLRHAMHLLALMMVVGVESAAGQANGQLSVPSPQSQSQEKNWLIEPIKLTSLMVNAHPEYNGWGLEVGRKLTDRIWAASMIENTKGGDFLKNFDPAYDFLITFKYFAWLNTFRYYLKPDARYSTFLDAGVEYQSAGHKFLRDDSVNEENARAAGPIVFVGGEWRFSETMYLKWRSGFFVNVYRGGDMKSRIDDGQDQPAFFMYPHLADAVIGKGTYAGDVAVGIRF